MLLQTCDELVKTLRKSALVPEDRLNDFLRNHPTKGSPSDYAKAMIQAELITAFQAEQLMQGKTRGYDLGRYRILKKLGGGATGIVFLAEHLIMKHRVAIKVLSNNHMQNEPTALARFRREARAASTLQHPNIVRTLDLDEDDGRHYLVMEYVEGTTLDVIGKKQPVPISTAVDFIAQSLNGLQHIHGAGLVHRDLKPGNLLMDKQGVVKILDLGLARFTNDNLGENITVQQGNMILGTLDFMAPEQADRSSAVDIRADIYSLGSTLYYMLSGQSPVPDGPMTAKIIALQFQNVKPIRQLRSDVDGTLESILNRMMAKDPESRYQDPKEAREALLSWVNNPRNANTTNAFNGDPRRNAPTTPMPALVSTGTMRGMPMQPNMHHSPAMVGTATLPQPIPSVNGTWRSVPQPLQSTARVQALPTQPHVQAMQPNMVATTPYPALSFTPEGITPTELPQKSGSSAVLLALLGSMLVALGAIITWFILK